jgi:polyisoprenoid-binding protein YceI
VKPGAWLLLMVLFLPGLHAQAADWRMEAASSRLEFVASYEKIAVPGVFREFDTRLSFDADKPAGSTLEVTVRIGSADMNSGDINNAIRTTDWFDSARFPQAEFRSTDIRRTEANRYLARGTLNLKGVQQAVEVPFTWAAARDGASMEGELTLKRGLFGIGRGEWAASNIIGADVKVKFRVVLRRAG